MSNRMMNTLPSKMQTILVDKSGIGGISLGIIPPSSNFAKLLQYHLSEESLIPSDR